MDETSSRNDIPSLLSEYERIVVEAGQAAGVLDRLHLLLDGVDRLDVPLSSSLAANLTLLQKILRDCGVTFRPFLAGARAGLVLFDASMSDTKQVARDVLGPVTQAVSPTSLENTASRLVHAADTRFTSTVGKVVTAVLSGETALLLDGENRALLLDTTRYASRAIEKPGTEAVVRGSNEGFVENLDVNLSLVRHRLQTPHFKIERRRLGRLTQTEVALCYIDDVVGIQLLKEVRRRLDTVQLDGVLESGYIEELITDNPYSPFPQVRLTERPDSFVANLLEGRCGILVDGTPFAFTAPVVLWEMLQAADDYYQRLSASFLRLLRYGLLVISLTLPSFYVAVTTYHQEMIPTRILWTLAAAREGVPYPAAVEALLLEIIIEIVREAGLRLPNVVGQTVNIVGVLILGQAAIQVGIASAPLVIVVAVTGITSFALPQLSFGIGIRLLRFPLMLLGAVFGIPGVILGILGIVHHVAALKSFGIPYLAPVAPFDWQSLKDVFVRPPHWMMRRRPWLIGGRNPRRSNLPEHLGEADRDRQTFDTGSAR